LLWHYVIENLERNRFGSKRRSGIVTELISSELPSPAEAGIAKAGKPAAIAGSSPKTGFFPIMRERRICRAARQY